MKSTIQYLEEAKEKLGLKSDYALAKWMGVTRAAISGYKSGRTTIDDYAAAKIADALGIPDIEVIYAANAERERNEERRDFWQKKLVELGGIAASIIFACVTLKVTLAPQEAMAQGLEGKRFPSVIHYAKYENYVGGWKRTYSCKSPWTVSIKKNPHQVRLLL